MVTHPFRIVPLCQAGGEETKKATPAAASATTERPALDLEEERRAARNAGWEEGFAVGRTAGTEAAHQEARTEIASLISALQARIVETDAEKQKIAVYLSEAVCDLGVRLAEALLAGNAVFDRSAIFADIVKEAQQDAVGRGTVVCRAHPATLARMSALLVSIECRPDEVMKEDSMDVTIVSEKTEEILVRWDARVERQIAALQNLVPNGKRKGQPARKAAQERQND